MESDAVLRWIECHPGLAGYVQAVGALVALFIAIEIPRRAAKRHTTERDRRVSRIVRESAKTLSGYVNLIATDAARARHMIFEYRERAPDETRQAVWFRSIRIYVPPAFETAVASLPDVESDELDHFRDLLRMALSHNSTVQGQELAVNASLAAFWHELYEIFICSADNTLRQAAEAKNVLRRVYAKGDAVT